MVQTPDGLPDTRVADVSLPDITRIIVTKRHFWQKNNLIFIVYFANNRISICQCVKIYNKKFYIYKKVKNEK